MFNSRKPIVITMIFSLLSITLPITADDQQESEIPPGAARLLSKTDIVTLSADFAQLRHLKFMSVPLKSSGRLLFRKPDSIVWLVDAPAKSRLVVSNGRALMEIPDLNHREILDADVDPVISELADHIVSIAAQDFSLMKKKYRIEFIPEKTVRLVPIDDKLKKAITMIRIEFISPGIISRMIMEQAGGDRIEISFSNVRLNPTLPSDAFKMDNG